VWPAGLLGDDVLLFDATRRTLVVDGHGRLAVGATFTEQLEAQRMIETRGIRAMARIDLFLIARMLGHSVARTTELYAHHHPSWLSGAAAALGAVTKSNAKPEKNKGSASDR
jgi:integrase